MKKIITFLILFFINLLVVSAMGNENINYNETTRYFKTITIINNNEFQTLEIQPRSYNMEITKEEYENYHSSQQNNLNSIKNGYTETNYKKMTTTMKKINETTFQLNVVLEWKTMPSTRSYDIIGIGFPKTVAATNSTYFEQNYCLDSGVCNKRTSHTLYKGTYGVGASFALPTDNIKSLSQSFSVNIKKNTNNTLTSLNISGDYSHAQKVISKDNAKKYYVDLAGINLDSSITNYYDSINAAVAVWNGSW